MSIATPTRSDHDIKTEVQDELEWTPELDAAGVGVAVGDGVVSLSGEVDNYSARIAAKRAALRVRGVTAIVDNVSVHPSSSSSLTETDIAKEVEYALRWAGNVPDAVKAEIRGHDVILTGQVTWDFQRQAAQRAVQHLTGVHFVNNLIALTPRVSVSDTKERIRNAITRNAQLDANTINVAVSDNQVTLTGTVRSWAEKQEAERAAWASSHVSGVHDQIVVQIS
ncbi:transport-associated protein [Segniliparus rotundus DSM 44985]|uniref:Transport-associated protein n=1 Tax=Segniliparus rotundus (strain ATCC BAA-972 / CDC 1076 / CIP 108378 / DSM 44985 / JCM 13578) TaxID=640132 RepID=D6ZAS4_SEGRD|nr:BON domain-containing protein [Segniliparus rotundus]ADG98810.1 transport-associated protein [Segniliparus rotundus DSM 44985]